MEIKISPCPFETYNKIFTFITGQFGGMRCQSALRPFVSELGMISLPSTVVIPLIQNTGIQEDGTCPDERISTNVAKLCKVK